MEPAIGGQLHVWIVYLNQLQKVKYAGVASMALIAYDFILTFVDEVRLVWDSKWNSVKVLFFATRYPVFIDGPLYLAMHFIPNLDIKLCKTFFATTSLLLYIGVSTASIIVLIRTYAIYGCNRSMGIILVTIFMGVNIPAMIFVNRSLKSLTFLSPSPLPTVAPCLVVSSDRIVFINFVFIIFIELGVVILTTWKGVYQWRANRGRLINTLVKDGVLYFLCLFAISTSIAIVLVTAPLLYSSLLMRFQRALHAILSARVILHIRAIADHNDSLSRSKSHTLPWDAAAGPFAVTNMEVTRSIQPTSQEEE